MPTQAASHAGERAGVRGGAMCHSKPLIRPAGTFFPTIVN